MDEVKLNFDQVHQITHNVDYAYAINEESLVFAPRSSKNSSELGPSIKCIFFCIIKKQIIFPLLFGNSSSTSESLSKQSSDNDKTNSNEPIFTSALAITNDSSTVIIGQSDGSLAILNLKQFLDLHLQTNEESDANTANLNSIKARFELPSNNCTIYKFIHKDEITNMSFLKGDKRVIIGDKTGMITLLSFVNSFTCELVVQTTIINLKMPYFMFEVYPEDNVFALASSKGFSVIKTGRRIEVLLCSEEETINPEICCAIEKFADDHSTLKSENQTNDKNEENSKIRVLICQNRSVSVYDIDNTANRKTDQWNFDLPVEDENSNSKISNPIIRCFIIRHFYFLLHFKNGDAVIVKDRTGEIVTKINDLPTNVNPSRIQLYENELIYFLKSDIVQKKINLPLE